MDCIKNATSDQLSKLGDNAASSGIQIDMNCITERLTKSLDQAGLKYKNNYGTFIVGGIRPDQGQKLLQRAMNGGPNSEGFLSTMLCYKKWILIGLIVLIVVGFLVYKFKFASSSEEGFFSGLITKVKGLFKRKSAEHTGGSVVTVVSKSKRSREHARRHSKHKRSERREPSVEYEEEGSGSVPEELDVSF